MCEETLSEFEVPNSEVQYAVFFLVKRTGTAKTKVTVRRF